MRRALIITGLVWLATATATAHEGRIVDLKTASQDHQVETLGYCKEVYHLKLKDGSAYEIKEFNLRFKTDSGPNGPHPGTPVLISAGMSGDRAFVIFAEPDEMKGMLKKTC